MTGGMTWETPPPSTRYDWAAIARELRAHPGDWLKVFDEGPVSAVNAIRQSSVAALTPIRRLRETHAGFEVRTRNNVSGPPRICTLYLRWMPEGRN